MKQSSSIKYPINFCDLGTLIISDPSVLFLNVSKLSNVSSFIVLTLNTGYVTLSNLVDFFLLPLNSPVTVTTTWSFFVNF